MSEVSDILFRRVLDSVERILSDVEIALRVSITAAIVMLLRLCGWISQRDSPVLTERVDHYVTDGEITEFGGE